MSKPRTEIKPESAERLKELLRERRLTQTQLAERTRISITTISKVVNGRTALTRYIADEIKAVFPDIRAEWLMGIDDVKTETEKSMEGFFRLKEWNNEWQQRIRAVSCLVQLAGYRIEPIDRTEQQSDGPSYILNFIRRGYKTTKDGEVLGHIKLDHFNMICAETEDFVVRQIRNYLEWAKDWQSNQHE